MSPVKCVVATVLIRVVVLAVKLCVVYSCPARKGSATLQQLSSEQVRGHSYSYVHTLVYVCVCAMAV